MNTNAHDFWMNLQYFAEDGEGQNDAAEQQNDAAEQGAERDAEKGEKTFSQADVDRLVAQRLARERKDEEKRLEAARAEGRSEAEKLAKMTEAQRLEHERQKADEAAKKREEDLAAREREIIRRELRAQAVETLNEKGLDAELADLLDYSDADACDKSIGLIEKVMQKAVQRGVEERMSPARNQLRRGAGSEDALMAAIREAAGLTNQTERKER